MNLLSRFRFYLHRPCSQQIFWIVTVGKTQVLLIILKMAQFYSTVPVSHSEPACTLPGPWNQKWNSAIVHFIINTCASLAPFALWMVWLPNKLSRLNTFDMKSFKYICKEHHDVNCFLKLWALCDAVWRSYT